MWEFIKYCLYCMATVVSSAFGHITDGATWKTVIIGGLTMLVLAIVLIAILCCFLVIVGLVMRVVKERSNKRKENVD